MNIEAHQIIRSQRKTLALIVQPDGSLIVRAPLRIPAASIAEFIEKNAAWIQKKQAQARNTPTVVQKQYMAGEQFLYLGIPYELEIVQEQTQSLQLTTKFQLSASAQEQAATAFEQWYREQAREVITERVSLFAKRHNLEYKQIKITSAQTRWGSCSANGSLNFAWRLVMAPIEVIDYVVVHELAHIVFHNHSKRFWRKVESMIPDYQKYRSWLRKNGTQLSL